MLVRPALIAACACALLVPLGTASALVQPREGALHLINGAGLEGWTAFPAGTDAGSDATWRFRRDGVLACTGTPTGYLRTVQAFANYRLTLEWRWPGAGGKSGVLVHGQGVDMVWPRSVEAELEAERAGDFWVSGGVNFKEKVNPDRMRTFRLEASSELPVGEWNTMEVVCALDTIEVYVNGVLQNRATQSTVNQGFIALQSDGSPIEFRNIVVHPLEPAGAEGEATENDAAAAEQG